MLLAACGGGGGNLTTSSQPEPEPPVIGPLVPSSEGDGEQQKIIVIQQEEPEEDEQNEESEEIIDIIIEQPEEEEEEENQEAQTQQIIIIEEEDIPYVPPEEKEPETSAQTQTTNGLNIGEEIISDRVTTTLEGSFPAGPTGGGGFPYGLWASEKVIHDNNFIDNRIAFLELSGFLNPTTRPGHYTPHQNNNADVRYEREDGFKGAYIYEGETGELTGDVELKLQFSSNSISVSGNISSDLEIEGKNLDGIVLTFGGIDSTTGVGYYTSEGTTAVAFGNADLSSQSFDLKDDVHDLGQAKLRMVLSPDGHNGRKYKGIVFQPVTYPSYIAGEVEINGFKIDAGDRDTNTIVGAFIGDNQEVPTPRPVDKSIQGSIGVFSYGIWASENFDILPNNIRFLEQTTRFNPTRTASNYTSHTISAGKIVAVSYRREDGFKGVYIYEGETGELTGDVDLILGFNDNTNSMGVTGEILTDLEIEGYDLKGISMLNGRINYNTGVGGIDIDADGVDDNNTSAKLSFGEFLIDDNAIDRPTLSHRGLVRKVRMVLSPDAIQAQGSTPESYPSQIAGEVEINGFKIKAGDGDHNTVVGVFIGDKQEQ